MSEVLFRCAHGEQRQPANVLTISCPACRRDASRTGKRGLALDGLMERVEILDSQQEEGTAMATASKTTAARKRPASKATKKVAKKAPAKRAKKTLVFVDHGARTRRTNRATGSVIATYCLLDPEAKPVDADGKRLDVKAPEGKPWLVVCETHGTLAYFPTWTAAGNAYNDVSHCRKCLAALG